MERPFVLDKKRLLPVIYSGPLLEDEGNSNTEDRGGGKRKEKGRCRNSISKKESAQVVELTCQEIKEKIQVREERRPPYNTPTFPARKSDIWTIGLE